MSSQKYYNKTYLDSINKPKTPRKHVAQKHPEKSANLKQKISSARIEFLTHGFPNVPVFDFCEGKSYKNPGKLIEESNWAQDEGHEIAGIIANELAAYKKSGQSTNDLQKHAAIVVLQTENSVEIVVCKKALAEDSFHGKQIFSHCPVWEASTIAVHPTVEVFCQRRFDNDPVDKLKFYQQVANAATTEKPALLVRHVEDNFHVEAFDPLDKADYSRYKKFAINSHNKRQVA